MRQTLSSLRGALVALLTTFLVATTLSAAPAQATPAPADPTASPSSGPSIDHELTADEGVKSAKAKDKKKAKNTKKSKKKKRAKKRKPVWRRAIAKARTRAGKPYRYGAAGPNAFDCSGLTSWAYRKAGKKIPRTSSAQASAAKRVKKPRRGDLVFFHNGGRVYHVGLYAGKNKVFHASKPGVPVGQARIWTSNVFFGRA